MGCDAEIIAIGPFSSQRGIFTRRAGMRAACVSAGDDGFDQNQSEKCDKISDTLWFGCRLGSNGPRKERFRGELDELWIADRALGPREIVSLMRDNQPLANGLVLQR